MSDTPNIGEVEESAYDIILAGIQALGSKAKRMEAALEKILEVSNVAFFASRDVRYKEIIDIAKEALGK